ncbi:MAG: photosynthetic reaction center cytochrome c subunit [Myxococcales bacterium]|nr:photosynthetic reaction center cytochrome c subunit [Myxococcales bacterium]
MRNKLLIASILGGLIASGYALTFSAPVANAGGLKNAKIYPKNTNKKAIKKDMKALSKALGVKCDYCHTMKALDKDSEMKEKARDMMRMMKAANKTLKAQGFEKSITCKTCHNGQKIPKY